MPTRLFSASFAVTPAAALASILLVTLSGCGGGPSNDFKVAPVKGTVTLGGKPVVGALVQFTPDAGPSSEGYADDQGNYELTANTGAGALIASHHVKVTVGLPRPASPDATTGVSETVPLGAAPPVDYVFETPVAVSSEPNSIDLKLETAKKRRG